MLKQSRAPHRTWTDLAPQWPDYVMNQQDAAAINEAVMPLPYPPASWRFGTITECALGDEPPPCSVICGDLNIDMVVDGVDYGQLLQAFFYEPGDVKFNPCADIDNDGVITDFDWSDWLTCYRDFTMNPLADPPTGEPGDIDFDGDLDLLDIHYYQLCVPLDPTLEVPCVDRFDIDSNGVTDVLDWAQLQPHLVGPGATP